MAKKTFNKRKNNGVSAYFFGILLSIGFITFSTSCKKQNFTNGKDLMSSQYGVNSKLMDTFNLVTYSILEDSIRSMKNNHTLFGAYNDPTFGQMRSDVYTQLLLDNPGAINFTSSQTIDSVVLSFQYNGYYGTPQSMNVGVYELTDLMNINDTMYQFSTVNHNNVNLVQSGYETINPDPVNKMVVGTDTVSPQMRIRLKPTFGLHLIDGVLQGAYATQDAFQNFFKGLYITTTSTNLAKGKGAIYYFSMTSLASGLTIYYKDLNNASKSFHYIINSNAMYFNHVDINRTGTKVEQVLNNTSQGASEFYAQAYGVRSVIEIPGIKNIPKGAIIHSAQLQLPFTSYYLDKMYPSAAVTIGYFDKNDFNKPVAIKTGNLYNSAINSYVIDINDFAANKIVPQNIIDGKIDTYKFFVIPDNFGQSAERIIFNGKNSSYKLKPKLTVIYTLN